MGRIPLLGVDHFETQSSLFTRRVYDLLSSDLRRTRRSPYIHPADPTPPMSGWSAPTQGRTIVNGIAILGSLPGSPVEECGLKYGDVLLSVNGEAMTTVEDFLRARSSAQDKLEIIVRRGAHVMELSISLDKRPPTQSSAAEAINQVQHLRLVPPLPETGPLN